MPVKPAIAARRVMVVMVDDQFDARPQSGLSGADVVWQAPAEGGIPRYMAFFQSGDPPAVGPVRSSRLYFIAWASEWRPLYVHAGGSPQARRCSRRRRAAAPSSTTPTSSAGAGPGTCGGSTRASRPTTCTRTASTCGRLAKRVGAEPVDGQKPAWNFADPLPLEQRPTGGGLAVPYLANKVSYKYDRASNTYRRSVTGEKKQTDAGTRTRIAPTNVIVMAVRFAPLNDGSHKSRLEAQVTGTGKAWISTNGKTIRGTWKKPGFRGKTQFFDRSGKKVTLTRRADLRPGGAAEREDHRHARPCADGVDRRDRRGRGPDRGRRAVHLLGPAARRANARRLPARASAPVAPPRPTPRASRARRPPTSARRRHAPGPRRPASRAGRRPTRPRGCAVASRAGSPGSTSTPCRPDDLGQGADRAGHDRHAGGKRVERGDPGRLGPDGLDEEPGPGDERGEAVVGQPRRVGDRVRDAGPDGRPRTAARSPGVAPTRHTRGGHAPRGPTAGGGSSARAASAANSVGRSWRAS